MKHKKEKKRKKKEERRKKKEKITPFGIRCRKAGG